MKVLHGIRAIDRSRVLAGPYCAQMLADFGATAMKVESPEGDENRRWPPLSPDGRSTDFRSVNRGKRSMALDLKNLGAKEIPRDLAAGADVSIHGFLPDTAARLGIGLEALQAANPGLVEAILTDTLGLSPARIAAPRAGGAFGMG